MSKWSAAFRDSRWQQKRLQIMERDNWTCRSCGASGDGVTLNVHHAYYESGKAPWDYPNQTLVTWCEDCHKARHDMQNQMLTEMARKPMSALRGLYALALNYEETLSYVGDHDSVIPYDDQLLLITKSAACVFYAGMQSVEDSEGASLIAAKELIDQKGGDE